MTTKLFAGIDIGLNEATVCCIDSEGKQLSPTRTVGNNLDGAREILAIIADLAADETHIGLEATSVYGSHLRDFLLNSSNSRNWFVYEINPSLVAGFKKSFPRRDITDSTDARMIAERVRLGYLRPYTKGDMLRQPLLQLTRHRLHLVKMIGQEKNRALNMIFLKFSNYKRDNPFSTVFGKASLAVLNQLSPDEIVNMDIQELLSFINRHSRNMLPDPEKAALTLKTIAQKAYRLHPKMSNSVNATLIMTLENINFLEKQLAKLDKLIASELKAIPQTLDTVTGIGPVYAAGIIAEIGDISRFPNEAALAQYAGLTWPRCQSGEFEAEERRLTKEGNRYLRYYLVEAANSLRVFNEEYKAYYQKKYAEVTKHRHKRALVLTARKFVRLVFALLSKGQIYRKEMMV